MADQIANQQPVTKLPEGTVTFLFTDIEGSTQLLSQLRDRYRTLLADQRCLLRKVFASWQGREVDTQGDAFFVAFPRATLAVLAAVEIQHALADHPWPEGVEVRVRMGLHTGEPWMVEEGYVGMDVHRAARIGSVGHGGQVLLSETTSTLVVNELPEGVSLKDLGRHRLKDMRRPEHIQQLVMTGLPHDFPPLKSLEVISPAPQEPGIATAREPRKTGASPYRGLAAFRETDASIFFGREAFTEQLALAVQERGLIAVIVGPSGSGKSSTVFAGLLPRLRDDDAWLIVETRPGIRPFNALADALLTSLEEDLTEADRLIETQKLARAMSDGELPLFQVVVRALNRRQNARRMLLVIDQFEELFTLQPDPEVQRLYLDELLAAAETGASYRCSPLVLLLTLRADFMGQALTHRPFADALQDCSLILGPMNRQELQAAIEKPAEQKGAAFESGLVQRILDDVGQEPGSLPLLEFALTLLWERIEGGWMTHAAYEEIGRVDGALARYAEEVYTELSLEEREEARRLFVQLVQPGEGTEDTRRVARRTELSDEGWSLVQYLADRRLVVTGRDESGEETVEVVHEALIRGWDRLRLWMKEDRAFRTWQEGLRLALRGWKASGHDEGALLRGAPLAMALERTGEHQIRIGPAELAYIKASQQESERQAAEEEARRQRELETAHQLAEMAQARAEEQTRSARRLRSRAVFLAGALVVAILLAVTAVIFSGQADRNAARAEENARLAATHSAAAVLESNQRATAQAEAVSERKLADEQARLATARELSASALNNLSIDPERSILLALHSLSTAHTLEAENALHRAIQASRVRLTLTGHAGPVYMVDVSPDGRKIATASQDRTAKIWDFDTGMELRTLIGHLDEVIGVDFSPDGTRLATSSYDGTAIVWDINSGEELLRLSGHEGPLVSVYYNPDGTRLITNGLYDGMVIVWDAYSGEALLRIRAHWIDNDPQPTWHVIYNQDGTRVATASMDGTAKIWDIESGDLLLTIDVQAGGVTRVAFSPDGKYLATAHDNGTAKIWDSSSGEELHLFKGHTGLVIWVCFSPDGKRLVTASVDGTAKIWDVLSGGELFALAGHSGMLMGLNITRDGKYLISGSYDKTAKVWDLTPAKELLTLDAHRDRVYSIDFNSDGTRLASGSFDGTAIIWDVKTGQEEIILGRMGDGDRIRAVAFSPDGTRLATSSADGTTTIWDATSGIELLILMGHAPGRGHIPGQTVEKGINGIIGVAFSPDGKLLATASDDLTAKVWDAATGKEIFTLSGHDHAPPSIPPFDGVIQVSFSPDGKRLATAGADGMVIIWDVVQGTKIYTLEAHPGSAVTDLAFSPDGKRLLTGGWDATAKLWDAQTGQALLTLPGHTNPVYGVAFTPDGERLVTGSEDGTARIWDAETGQPLLVLTGHSRTILDIAVSSDGKYLAAAGEDGSIRFYVLPVDELISLAQSRLTRSLTEEECRQFLHLEECSSN